MERLGLRVPARLQGGGYIYDHLLRDEVQATCRSSFIQVFAYLLTHEGDPR